MPPHHAVMDNSIYPPLAKIHKICTTYSIWSYGKQRGLVSPVGAQEATAYADALSYMLATPGWNAPIGRAASVVCWSDDADPRYPVTPSCIRPAFGRPRRPKTPTAWTRACRAM